LAQRSSRKIKREGLSQSGKVVRTRLVLRELYYITYLVDLKKPRPKGAVIEKRREDREGEDLASN